MRPGHPANWVQDVVSTSPNIFRFLPLQILTKDRFESECKVHLDPQDPSKTCLIGCSISAWSNWLILGRDSRDNRLRVEHFRAGAAPFLLAAVIRESDWDLHPGTFGRDRVIR